MFELILNSIRRHTALSESDAETIISHLKVKKIRKNQLLTEPPDAVNTEHFINNGCFRHYFLDQDGVQHTLGFATAGGWITDLQSFFSGKPAVYYVESLEESEILVLRKQDLDKLFNLVPSLNVYFRIIYQNAIISQNERLLNMLSKTADERYLWFIQKYPALEGRLPQYLIASYLGITPEFLSKVKSRISEKQARS